MIGNGTNYKKREERPPTTHLRGSTSRTWCLVSLSAALVDLCGVVVSGLVMFYVRFHVFSGSGRDSFWKDPNLPFHGSIFLGFGLLVVLSNRSFRLYGVVERRSVVGETFDLLRAYLLAAAVLILLLYLAKLHTPWGSTRISRVLIVATAILSFVVSLSVRLLKRKLMLLKVAAGFGRRNVAIVGACDSGYALAKYLRENPQLGYHVCGFLDDHNGGGPDFLGHTGQLADIAKAYSIHEIIYVPPSEHRLPPALVMAARNHGVGMKVVPEYIYNPGSGAHIEGLGDFFIVSLS